MSKRISSNRQRGRPRKTARVDDAECAYDESDAKLELQSNVSDSDVEVHDRWTDTPDTTDRKKATHLRCERQRREAINSGYNELKALLPASLASLGCKTTNASILFRAAEYMRQLESKRNENEEALARLRCEKQTLQLLAEQYQAIAHSKMEQNRQLTNITDTTPVGAQASVLCRVFDRLNESFRRDVKLDSHASMVRTLVTWIERQDVETLVREALQEIPANLQ